MTVSEHMHEDMADMIMDNFLSRVSDKAWEMTQKTLGMSRDEIIGYMEQEIHDADHIRVMDTLCGYQVQLVTETTMKALAHMNGWDR